MSGGQTITTNYRYRMGAILHRKKEKNFFANTAKTKKMSYCSFSLSVVCGSGLRENLACALFTATVLAKRFSSISFSKENSARTVHLEVGE